ncbi:MAG TPA: hypothetical protein VKY85_14835 [Candidatus Angelobacter sp.]|nr:hypothetical protein [Candidatus Angelobacter sp.]
MPLLLPSLARASISSRKLRDYVLDEEHPLGCHKARVFKSVLGIDKRHADALAEIIRGSLPRALAQRRKSDEHGHRWVTHHEMVGVNAPAIVTVAWIFKTEEPDIPVLVSCYIDTERQEELARLLRGARVL